MAVALGATKPTKEKNGGKKNASEKGAATAENNSK